MLYYTTFDTPQWAIILVGDDTGLTNLHMVTGEGSREFEIDKAWTRDDARFAEARLQVEEYLNGKRTDFTIPLNPQGTDFQKKAWKALCEIPYGEVRTYGEQAALLGNPKASRAVGAANGRNPIPLIIPCHRVVGANGKLTGFAHGLAAKEMLITMEQQHS